MDFSGSLRFFIGYNEQTGVLGGARKAGGHLAQASVDFMSMNMKSC